jgi:hypothetical protein
MGRQKKFIPLLAFLLLPQEARGQEAEERQIKYKERTEIDFEGVDITGELVKPAGSLVMDRRKAQFNPLIRLRQDFDDKMKESIDEVK